MMIPVLFTINFFAFLCCSVALAADFNHTEHLTYLDEVNCMTCHVEGAVEIVPAKSICLECHEQEFVDTVVLPGSKTHGMKWAINHRAFAKNKVYDCAACHQQNFCLDCHKSGFANEMGDPGNSLANVHRSEFSVSHPIAARTNPQFCSSCHEPNFCSECHARFEPVDQALSSHRRGWSDISLGESGPAHAQFTESSCQNCHPNSVLPSHEWSNRHAREARKNLATCQACHPEGDICLKCHSAKSGLMVNPHPSGWDGIKDRLERASSGKTCRKCH
jgi:hypothetical protein